MKHVLRISTLGNNPEVGLSEKEFQEIVKSRNILLNILGAEEKYEIILTNYRNFENKCLEISNEFMTRIPSGYSDAFDTRLELNIHVVNLLTSVRLYLDQLMPHVRSCMGENSEIKEEVKKWLTDEYNNNKSYRFMEALRNHLQHRGLPIHLVRNNMKRTPPELDGYFEYTTFVAVDIRRLREDKKFKKTLLKELEEKTDLVLSVRRYVESLSTIHHKMRQFLKSRVILAREKIMEAHEKYSKLNNGKTLGLNVETWKDQKQVESLPLLLDWDDVRIELQKRNHKLENLSKRYVSSKSSTNTNE